MKYLAGIVCAGLLGWLLAGCSRAQPVTGQVVLAAEQTQRGIVGYEDVEYQYPIRVPGTYRYVEMTSRGPLNQPPTYDDYLSWKQAP